MLQDAHMCVVGLIISVEPHQRSAIVSKQQH